MFSNRTVSTQTITSTLVTTYTYDAANRLTAVNGVPYTWDANGNLLSDGSKTYLYNTANQLITVTAPGLTWSAAYNGDGARLRQTVNGVPMTYTLDLAAPLVTVLAQHATRTTQYVYGQGDSLLAGYDGTAWTYLSGRDGINSVRQETDGGGNVLAVRGFDPYGVPLSGNGGAPFGYTGEMADVTGLVFLRARYMQPGLGMFLSRDLYEGNLSQPPSQHLFAYVGNNPINRTDPSGQYWYDPINDRWVQGGVSYLQAPYHPKIEFYAPTNPYRERQDVFNWIMPRARKMESRAGQYGIPPELVAAILAVEIDDDLEPLDDMLDSYARMCYRWIRFKELYPADSWLDTCGCVAFLNVYASIGIGVGIAQIHVNRPDYDWWAIVQHLQSQSVPIPTWANDPVENLLIDDGAIEGVAMFGRALADVRTGINAPHGRGNLSLDDMAIIFVGYRYGVGGFTDVSRPSSVFRDVFAFQSYSRDNLGNAHRDFDIAQPYADAFQFYFEHIGLYEAEYGR